MNIAPIPNNTTRLTEMALGMQTWDTTVTMSNMFNSPVMLSSSTWYASALVGVGVRIKRNPERMVELLGCDSSDMFDIYGTLRDRFAALGYCEEDCDFDMAVRIAILELEMELS